MATTDTVFGQLERSHRRLEERLDDLPRAAADLDGPKHDEALAYILDTVAWMERAVRRHEEDEEQSLFPRLGGRGLDGLMQALADEHQRHERLQAKLAQASQLPAAEVRGIVDELVEAYRRHIDEEERELFPAAKQALDAGALDEIAAEMEARRAGDRGRGHRRRPEKP